MRHLSKTIFLALAICSVNALAANAQVPESAAARASIAGGRADMQRASDDFDTRLRVEGRLSSPFRRNRAARTDVQIAADAREAARAAGLDCIIGQAREIGDLEDKSTLYEVTCASGPGYLVKNGAVPDKFDCLQLASVAEMKAASGAAPDEGSATCEFAANKDRVAMIKPLAEAAKLNCNIDNAIYLGQTEDGAQRYEVGCSDADGYLIETRADGSFSKLPCLATAGTGVGCMYTTKVEQIASIQAILRGTSAPDCDIDDVVSRGGNSSGIFYEVSCGSKEGFIFRAGSTDGAFQQAYPCAVATSIDGGCRLGAAATQRAQTDSSRIGRLAAAGVSCTATNQLRLGQERSENGREVVEFACSDRALGLVAFIPPAGSDSEIIAEDCIAATRFGIVCNLTDAAALKTALTASLRAGGTDCSVTAFKAQSSLGADVGDEVEVKCQNASSYLVDVPARRSAPSVARPCSALGPNEACKL